MPELIKYFYYVLKVEAYHIYFNSSSELIYQFFPHYSYENHRRINSFSTTMISPRAFGYWLGRLPERQFPFLAFDTPEDIIWRHMLTCVEPVPPWNVMTVNMFIIHLCMNTGAKLLKLCHITGEWNGMENELRTNNWRTHLGSSKNVIKVHKMRRVCLSIFQSTVGEHL